MRRKARYIVHNRSKTTSYRVVNAFFEHEQEKRKLLLLMCKNAPAMASVGNTSTSRDEDIAMYLYQDLSIIEIGESRY